MAIQRVRAEPGHQMHLGAIHGLKFANLVKLHTLAQDVHATFL